MTSNYTTTLASPHSKEHEGLGGFFDEVYVKDAEGFVIGKFYGPTSWGLARKFIELMDKLHKNDLDVDLNPKPVERRKVNRPENWMYGIPLHEERRAQ